MRTGFVSIGGLGRGWGLGVGVGDVAWIFGLAFGVGELGEVEQQFGAGRAVFGRPRRRAQPGGGCASSQA